MTGLLIFAVLFTAMLYAFVRFAGWVRRKGVGGGLVGPIDEAWHPSADRFRRETAVHEQRVMPPRPGDERS
ncbi:hypothetical protein [Actinoplanes teichomyceticus]|uniref:Uncharacterized protein n=1 Tax=Actinoplanes teichomyceticus TaxID=1867 RepID=A0A561WJH7_ACTTI|nr:hypothetical protein [Actinoplanes teichomyceticus]TWG24008.1 hypothetical protein FHX34_102561 [Actinoplanes teichomyceticus]GIF12050.1 hypothetical protein Ate01nite_20820 [Actinoplanes teichomyceticus]